MHGSRPPGRARARRIHRGGWPPRLRCGWRRQTADALHCRRRGPGPQGLVT